MNRGFKADCWYGASGLRKTTNIGRCAVRWWKKYGLKTRLISSDGGGWEPIQSEIDAGIIEAWPILLWPKRIEALDLACQGYWPKDLQDPAKGYHQPATLKDAGIGLMAYEGLTSGGDMVMSSLRQPGVRLTSDPSYQLKDGDQTYVGSNMTNYGFVQDRLYDFVMKSQMIPHIHKFIWTALEAKGEEDGTKLPTFGPAIVGKKATGKAGQWFGNLIHLEAVASAPVEDKVTKQMSIKTEVYAYLRTHADPVSKIPFPAKVRAPYQFAGEVPEHMPAEIDKIYDKLDELKAKADLETAKLKLQPQVVKV